MRTRIGSGWGMIGGEEAGPIGTPSKEPPRALVVIAAILCMHYWDILVLLVSSPMLCLVWPGMNDSLVVPRRRAGILNHLIPDVK